MLDRNFSERNFDCLYSRKGFERRQGTRTTGLAIVRSDFILSHGFGGDCGRSSIPNRMVSVALFGLGNRRTCRRAVGNFDISSFEVHGTASECIECFDRKSSFPTLLPLIIVTLGLVLVIVGQRADAVNHRH